jgi:hypothetical protein
VVVLDPTLAIPSTDFRRLLDSDDVLRLAEGLLAWFDEPLWKVGVVAALRNERLYDPGVLNDCIPGEVRPIDVASEYHLER